MEELTARGAVPLGFSETEILWKRSQGREDFNTAGTAPSTHARWKTDCGKRSAHLMRPREYSSPPTRGSRAQQSRDPATRCSTCSSSLKMAAGEMTRKTTWKLLHAYLHTTLFPCTRCAHVQLCTAAVVIFCDSAIPFRRANLRGVWPRNKSCPQSCVPRGFALCAP